MYKGAAIDPTGRYRYVLCRAWDSSAPCLGFVMLNPSAADARVDDPTLRRCMGFARAWGFGALEVVNLFAYRTPDPAVLRRVADPVGPQGDRYLLALGQRVETIVVAWGVHGGFQGRDQVVLRLLNTQTHLYCLGVTQSGQPRHPLYLSRNTPLVPFPS